MLEKLKQLSQLMVIPSVVLYLLGFLCYSAYLARFGLINFEVLNAHFIAAGFFTGLCLVIAIAIARSTYRDFRDTPPFQLRRWQLRVANYLAFPFFVLSSSIVISSFLRLASYRPRSDGQLEFSTLFNNQDWLGRLLVAYGSASDPNFDYLLKTFLYVLALAIVPFATFAFIALIGPRLKKAAEAHTNLQVSTAPSLPLTQNSGSATEIAALDNRLATVPASTKLLVWLIDTMAICAWASLLWWSYKILHVELFELDSSEPLPKLSDRTMFSWMFLTATFGLASVGLAEKLKSKGELFDRASRATFPTDLLQLVFVPLLLSVVWFGSAVFPRIPFSIGGGEPREVIVGMVDKSLPSHGRRMFLIGENSQFFFLVDGQKDKQQGLQIGKAQIAYMEMSSSSGQK